MEEGAGWRELLTSWRPGSGMRGEWGGDAPFQVTPPVIHFFWTELASNSCKVLLLVTSLRLPPLNGWGFGGLWR